MLQPSKGPSSDLAGEYSAIVHEMAEALQAITGYVGAARRIAIRTIEDSPSPLLTILEKAENQVFRANRAFRNAHNESVQTPEGAPVDDASPRAGDEQILQVSLATGQS
jgi:hypothetical protein